MKYITKLLLGCCLGLSSCYDLDLNPLSQASSENWYSDETEIEMSIKDFYRDDFWPLDNEDKTDNFIYRETPSEIIKGTLNGQSSDVTTLWSNQYKSIARVNTILEKLENASELGISEEKIKQYKATIDVLTMTATPIPRTLQMSVVGIRDMSVIYEPPQNRKPIQTQVLEYDKEVIKEAITKELERNGQVFYIYNIVESIARKAQEIESLVPEAKVAYAHGKMSGGEIEDIMQDFIDGKTNVLVCTTILESGIDIPNANTIIVENADRFGLAQLYQIRGRVGRSDKQAYAYITYKRDKMLSEDATQRLKAIKEFTEFG